MKIFVVAGELSGDLLGAGLLRALKQVYPQAEFQGIGGRQMQAAGLQSLFPLESLSVMGLVEVLQHLPRLIHIRRHLIRTALAWRADLVIGIDAPDFNLGLEKRLKAAGIPSVHYVSPSVWAWRQGRIHTIKQSVDLMLTLLPFEADFYRQHQQAVCFVGHPQADALPLYPDQAQARRDLNQLAPFAQRPLPEPAPLDQVFQLQDRPVIALLPGSRQGEVARLGSLFLRTAQRLNHWYPHAHFVLVAASPQRAQELAALCRLFYLPRLHVIEGHATQVLTAADVALLASGTVTLEASLCHTPSVVAYQLAPLTWQLAKRLVKVPYVSLPNLLAQAPLIPERLQDAATPKHLAQDLLQWLVHPEQRTHWRAQCVQIQHKLRQDASATAAAAIAELMD